MAKNKAEDLGVARPRVTRVEGVAVQGKPLGISLAQGQLVTVEHIFRNSEGNPVNFGGADDETVSSSSAGNVASPLRVLVKVAEALSIGCQGAAVDASGRFHDAENGVIRFELPSTCVQLPGVLVCEVGVLDLQGQLLQSNRLYAIVNRGMFGTPSAVGFPTTEQIRTRLRDMPDSNFHLADQEFDDAEIAEAIVRACRWWNEAQPPVPVRFNTRTYPFEEKAYDALKAALYETAALHYLREDVVYSAAGVTYRDKDKHSQYMSLAELFRKEYLRWVQLKKAQYNVESGFRSFGSFYGRC